MAFWASVSRYCAHAEDGQFSPCTSGVSVGAHGAVVHLCAAPCDSEAVARPRERVAACKPESLRMLRPEGAAARSTLSHYCNSCS